MDCGVPTAELPEPSKSDISRLLAVTEAPCADLFDAPGIVEGLDDELKLLADVPVSKPAVAPGKSSDAASVEP